MKFLESYLITFALMNACGRKTTDIFSILFFSVTYGLIKKMPEERAKKDRVIAMACSGIFTVFYVLGNKENLSGGLTNRAFLAFYMGCTIVGLLCLFYRSVLFILINSIKINLFEEKKRFSVKLFLAFAGLVFLCMIPFLLTNFPAVMTPDSLSQYRQVTGLERYNDHHPWMHTLIFNLFYEMGFAVSGDTYIAIACYTIVQMLLVAICISYVWTTLYEMGLKKIYCVTGVLLFVIYPYNLIYGVTIWKDILFSMSVLVLTLTLFRIHLQIRLDEKVCNRDWVLYFLCGFFMCMLRHNGFYAFLVAGPVLIYFMRKKWKIVFPLTVLIVVMCFIIKGPVMTVADVEPGKFAYKLCIPLQQIGRVIADGCELTEEEIQKIENINEIYYVRENYQKHGADPMFAWVIYGNQDYLQEHIKEYFELWISVGLRYPDKYLQAFIDQTKGYWYPMDPGQTVYFGITENANGLVSQPILKGPIVIKFHELLMKAYEIFPIYGIMYSMGAVLWFFIILLAVAFRNGNYSTWIAGSPVLLLAMTLLIAVPLVADIRYGYPLLITLPTIAAITFYNKQENTNEEIYGRI